jgi:hypothetical protein
VSTHASGRQRLAEQQAALLRALLAGDAVPDGFDATRVAAQAAALLDKRRRVTALLRPDLAKALGDRFRALFDGYALGHPKQAGRSAREDAAAFAAWLTEHGHLPRRGVFRRLRRRGNPARVS